MLGTLAVAGSLMLIKRHAAREAAALMTEVKTEPASQPALAAPPLEAPAPETADPPPEMAAPEALQPAPPDQAKPQKAARQQQSGKKPKPPLKDEGARVALCFVGSDPEAEAYWYDAINNPDLPANERQDLIEDLNEEGLADRKNPTPEDLPIIINRILILEGLDPMDKVNADATDEALKDLYNLLVRGLGR